MKSGREKERETSCNQISEKDPAAFFPLQEAQKIISTKAEGFFFFLLP